MSHIKEIRFHHTGISAFDIGFLIDNKVMLKADPFVDYTKTFVIDKYLQDKFLVFTTDELFEKTKLIIDDNIYLPAFWNVVYHMRCQNRLIQIEIDGRWGFANIDSGVILNEPIWDFCGPFSNGYAIVWEDCPGKPGGRGVGRPGNVLVPKNQWYQHPWLLSDDARCGYIDVTGKVVIPVMYKDGEAYTENGTFVTKFASRSWGVVNKENIVLVNFDWTYLDRVTKEEGKWDGYCGYSELKKKKYFKYNSNGQFLGSLLWKKDFDNSICFKYKDKELRFIEKNEMLYIVENGQTSTWNDSYPIIVEFLDHALNDLRPTI